jgi:hypothetical protein
MTKKFVETTQGLISEQDAKKKSVLQIWVNRFGEAQAKIKQLEEELTGLRSRLNYMTKLSTIALEGLPDERLAQIAEEVQLQEDLPETEAESDGGCGSSCGCSS